MEVYSCFSLLFPHVHINQRRKSHEGRELKNSGHQNPGNADADTNVCYGTGRQIRTGVQNTKEMYSRSDPCSPGTHDIINTSLNDFVLELQDRSIIHQREHRPSCF
jgi:hypothetical protein